MNSRPLPEFEEYVEVILFYKGIDVPTRQILDSKGVVPRMSVADAKKAIQELANHSQIWNDGTYTRNKSSNTSDELATIQAQLNNLGMEIKKVNERVYIAQVGCELCKEPHYTKECSLKEEGKTLKEAYYTQFGVLFSQEIRASTNVAIKNQGASIKALEIQIGQMSKVLQERGSRSLPSSTKTNPIGHVKSITTTEKAEILKEDDKMPLTELSRVTIPFPDRLKENDYGEKEILMKL
ncbi:hypothetical protein Tco_0835379 [Tanacetum coccineum]